jgi:hypothetical protein
MNPILLNALTNNITMQQHFLPVFNTASPTSQIASNIHKMSPILLNALTNNITMQQHFLPALQSHKIYTIRRPE